MREREDSAMPSESFGGRSDKPLLSSIWRINTKKTGDDKIYAEN